MSTPLEEVLTKLAGTQTGGEVPAESATESSIDPLYIEKLASAMDFVVDGFDGGMVLPVSDDSAQSVDRETVHTKLASALKKRVAVSAATKTEEKENTLAQMVLQKLAYAKAEEAGAEEPAATEGGEAEPAQSDDVEEPSTEDLSGMSLSSVLEDALGGSEREESLDTQVETGTDRDSESGNNAKSRTLLQQRLRVIASGKKEGK